MKKKITVSLILLLLVFTVSIASAAITLPAEINQKNGCLIFGCYKQKYYNSIDAISLVNPGKDPIEWIILNQDGSKLFLISKYPLDYKQFNSQKGNFSWKDSSIRSWLNHDFYNTAFTDDEKNAILTVDIESGAEAIEDKWPVVKQERTQDKIFLINYAEMKRYLKDDKVTLDGYLEMTSGGIFTTDDTWWLRSSGKKEDEVYFAGHGKKESGWLTDWRCIRPAMFIDTSLFDWNNSRYVRYQTSDNLAKAKEYPEAYAITDSLDDYAGSNLVSAKYRLEYAKAAAESGEYDIAIDRYNELKRYIGATFSVQNELFGEDEKAALLKYFEVNNALLDNKYQLAIQKKESGDIASAIAMFTDVGQYKNSMQYLRECFDKQHIQYSWLTGPDDLVNAGSNGYNEDKAINGNDPHFGWSMGRFMMSGFTELKEENGRHVFIKTPGDSLIFWFDLEQKDIDALNNDKSLSINSDKDGFDERMHYSKQKDGLGRGLLLVRHTDFRNSTSDPQPYTNYLVASDDTGADTKIEIKEEGIYDVALDYEVKKDAFFDQYNNYRIAFRFEVRNGSGMFFMFDVGTGTELQDYSRTADGFRIDLANSHSLSVSYTRYAMNQEETGLDVRKTGLASDGDSFEKVGYYEVTVTNKETGEELTKHIFVGRAADLEEYQAVDDALAKFSK